MQDHGCESPCAAREHHEVRQAIGDEPCHSHRSTLYEVIQEKRYISTSLETKSDRQSSTHAGVQETLSTKLREEIQQLRMNHDSKHREIDTEVKTKDPRRAMEQVLELDEANETVRWSSQPCGGRTEGSERTQEQPALLVSLPKRRRIQDRRRTKSVCRRLS